MDNQKQELIQKLQGASNVLVTVSSNPSVDQLAACIGLTIFLNKMNKHATAVFSGQVPSTLEFLKPEETLEKNTDSLRDFIVSLDKSKADKLRYKVEDNVVKIFITPYKTSITEADLDFSQGDFNIDVVICLGVEKQADLDQAITSHGRILHDATVASVSVGAAGELGSLNWVEPAASSLSELAAQMADALGREQIDGQIATAFLTGIVAETKRFSNEKTSPTTMQISAQLMSAGANQQLVASELQGDDSTLAINAAAPAPTQSDAAGTLEVDHEGSKEGSSDDKPDDQPPALPVEVPEPPKDDSGSGNSTPDAGTSDSGSDPTGDQPPAGPAAESPTSRLILQPPSMGGTLTANSAPEGFDPSVDPLTLLNNQSPMLSHDPAADAKPAEPATTPLPPAEPVTMPTENVALPEVKPLDTTSAPATDPLPGFEPLPTEPAATPAAPPIDPTEKSLSELEEAVGSPHLHAADAPAPAAPAPDSAAPAPDLDAARDAVMTAVNSAPPTGPLPPTQALGAEGYLNVQELADATAEPAAPAAPVTPAGPVPSAAPQPNLTIPPADPTPPTSTSSAPSTAPPVPPPLPLDPTQFTEPKQ